MFNFGSTTLNNTSFFGQSTPVNTNRASNSFSSNNTTSPTTSFLSSNLFGATTLLQPSTLETTTFSKYEAAVRIDKNDEQTSIQPSSSNELQADDQKLSLPPTTLPSFLFDNKLQKTTATPFSFDRNQPMSTMALSNAPPPFFPTTTNMTPNFSLSKPSTMPPLFSIMNQSSTDLKLFQTILNTQPFNNELTFLARNLKPSVARARRHTASDTSIVHPPKNPFFSVLTKPSVLSTFPTQATPSSSTYPKKRKFTDSFLDDDPTSTNIISEIHIKRPRMLDMNKIRSIVLGNNESSESIRAQKNEPISTKKSDHRVFRLPKLTQKDYYTKPTIEELRSLFNEQGQCLIRQFTVGRKHYGSVTFQGLHMNLAGLDLDRLVEIDHRQVTVYPNDKDRPIEGEELNCQAIISLFGVYPIDRSIANSGEEVTDCDRLIEMNYGKYLEEMTKNSMDNFLIMMFIQAHGHFKWNISNDFMFTFDLWSIDCLNSSDLDHFFRQSICLLVEIMSNIFLSSFLLN